jgi:prevent-host-death family protein
MSTVSIKDGKNRFPELARAAEKGETITVTRNGQAVCAIIPLEKLPKTSGIDWEAGERYLRDNGIKRTGKFWIAPDFDDPLPEDFLITPLPADFDKPKSRKRR